MAQRLSPHAAVAGVFFALGVAIGLWGGASGAILARAGVAPGAFGVILTVYTAAYLLAMSAGGALAHRFGARRVLTAGALSFAAGMGALLNVRSALLVAGLLIAAGFLGGIVDVTMNAEGARIERRLGRPILARLHAAASSGMAIGAILGSLTIASAAPWAPGVIAALSLALSGLAYDWAARGDEAPAPRPAAKAAGLSFAPALIGLGAVVGVSIAAETAALLWSTLLLRAEAPRLDAIAGLGAAFFSLCQAVLRFNADFIRLRISDQRIIAGSFAAAALGFGLSAADRGFALSVAGFALIGIGTGAIVPCGFALAARAGGAQPAVGLASASLFSAMTRLPAPLITGALAQAFSLPTAFAGFAVALAAAAGLMAAFAPPPPAARTTKLQNRIAPR